MIFKRPHQIAKPRRRSRGILLVEMITYVAILSIAMVLLAELFESLMKVTRETAARDTLIGRVDLALDSLRRDAWSATEMTVRGNDVEMKEPGGTIRWQMGEDGVLTRSDGTGPLHSWSWKSMPKVSFAVQGAVLTVKMDAGVGDKQDEVALISQRMTGGKP